MTTQSEAAVQRAAEAIASVIMRGGDHIMAARAALEAARPSDAMAERAARLLLTKSGELPEVHAAIGEPLRPVCGNPEGFGPGGHSTMLLAITCQGCMDKVGDNEDQLAEWERWSREGIPEDRRGRPVAEFIAEARALRGEGG